MFLEIMPLLEEAERPNDELPVEKPLDFDEDTGFEDEDDEDDEDWDDEDEED